jgi:hypothetical protein
MLDPNWRSLFYAVNSLSQSDPAGVAAQLGNVSPPISDVIPKTITKDRFVSQQAQKSLDTRQFGICFERNR